MAYSINERLKNIRKALGLTQRELADMLCISKPAVSAYECGSRNLPDHLRKSLCQQFHVSSDYLLSGSGDMFDSDDSYFINALAAVYSLTEQDVAIISAYIHMKPSDRAVIANFFRLIQKNMSR